MRNIFELRWKKFTYVFSLTFNWNLAFLSNAKVSAGNFGYISSTFVFVPNRNHRFFFILCFSCDTYLKITSVLNTNLKFPVDITPIFTSYYIMHLLLITSLFLRILGNYNMVVLLYSIVSFILYIYIMS